MSMFPTYLGFAILSRDLLHVAVLHPLNFICMYYIHLYTANPSTPWYNLTGWMDMGEMYIVGIMSEGRINKIIYD
jgi:hypothetical protein